MAKRFFRKLLKGQGRGPWRLVTDKLVEAIYCKLLCDNWPLPHRIASLLKASAKGEGCHASLMGTLSSPIDNR